MCFVRVHLGRASPYTLTPYGMLDKVGRSIQIYHHHRLLSGIAHMGRGDRTFFNFFVPWLVSLPTPSESACPFKDIPSTYFSPQLARETQGN